VRISHINATSEPAGGWALVERADLAAAHLDLAVWQVDARRKDMADE
jgi:hypothetical protein